MNLTSIKNVVTSKLGRQLLITKKHSPKIMFAAGVIGVGATVYLACRATLKVEEVLDEYETKKTQAETVRDNNHTPYDDGDYQKDMVVLHVQTFAKLLKLYGPSIVTGVTAVALLTGAHVVLNRRNVAMTAAYAALEKGFSQYRKRVSDELGIEKERDFHRGLVDVETIEQTADGEKKTVTKGIREGSGSVYSRFFDESNKNWNKGPMYNQMFLRCQQDWANDLLRARGHVFLNEVYDMLGMERSSAGAVVGWVKGNGDGYIDFGVFDGDTYMGQEFVNGSERSVLLDFNVDGVVYDKI